MAFNTAGSAEVPLTTFGSLVTEVAPSDLPEGVSPDNFDVEYLPGGVNTRRGFSRVYATLGISTITYEKSYVASDGTTYNLILDSQGNLWVENVTAGAPPTIEITVTPGSYAKSITAFGREYIAISDSLHGTTIPYQFDGTYFDRVTQDGPAVAPTVVSAQIPPSTMATSGTPTVLTLTECDPAAFNGSFYGGIDIYTNDSVADAFVGQGIVVAGNATTALNGSYAISAIYPGSPNLITAGAYFQNGTLFGLGGTGTLNGGTTMQRAGNVVTVETTGVNNLQPGYQVQTTGVPAASVGGGIIEARINNEDFPGLATITTTGPHGLSPGLQVSLTGLTAPAPLTISTANRSAGVVTVVLTAPTNLTAGQVIGISGSSDPSFDTSTQALTVLDDLHFTYYQNNATDAGSTGGTINLFWPIPDSTTPYSYEVVSAPSATTFQVQINYGDGVWGGGVVSYAWDGIFFVSKTLSPTRFQYQQYGPDAIANVAGTVSPVGQAAPGPHLCQVCYLTRQGAITSPGPPVKFIANGGQYLVVTNIPIGPSNVVARILAFTGANGSLFYYIPNTPQINGQIVGTATQINDNTSTAATLDFSDNTLYQALGINIPGNNLPAQIRLDSLLGFAYYNSQLIAYGRRNIVQNLLNMAFDGGYVVASGLEQPNGWNVTNPYAGATVELNGIFGFAWNVIISGLDTSPENFGTLAQSFYQDYSGSPIGLVNQTYRLRVWLKASVYEPNVSFVAKIISPSASFTSTATIPGSSITTDGGWYEAAFSIPTLSTIAPDTALTITVTGSTGMVFPYTLQIDELNIILADSPFVETTAIGSYVNNPEGFDGVTGNFGPASDTRKIMGLAVIRNVLYLLTRDPFGKLHEVTANGVTQPSGWSVDEIGSNCGLLSTFGLTVSQANDGTGSGGEEWIAWASKSGARIFGGGQPWKISQEIQPDWETINDTAASTIWAINDIDERVIYFGLPTLAATAPNLVYPLNYKDLDSAEQIAQAAPVRTGFSGLLATGDISRKWTRWNLSFNGAAIIYRPDGGTKLVFFAGNGEFPTDADAGFGNVYALTNGKLSDDDYGIIRSYYFTYPFVTADKAAALRLGSHRLLLKYLTAVISGTGNVIITAYGNSLTNPWPLKCARTLSDPSNVDLEWGGGNFIAQRMFFKVESTPIAGTDNRFSLSQLSPSLMPAKVGVRGAAEAVTRQTTNIIQLQKLDPRYTMYMRGFDRRGCTAAITRATENSFRVTGVWSDLADFVVLMLWDADDLFGHLFTSKYLPDFAMQGITLDFDLSITNGMYPGSAKFQSVPWGILSTIAEDGTPNNPSTTAPLTITSTSGQKQASATFTIIVPGGVTVIYDRVQVIYAGNYVFEYFAFTGGDTATEVAAKIVSDVNMMHATNPLLVPLTASNSGATITIIADAPGTDGNTIQLLARYKTDTTIIAPYSLVKLQGGQDPTSFHVSTTFFTNGSTTPYRIRQAWLTLAPPLPIDVSASQSTLAPFTQKNFAYNFSNWTVSDGTSNRALKIAGQGSVTIGNGNPLSVYSGNWTQQSGAYFQGYIEGSANTGDAVTITYTSGCVHDIYVGTALNSDRGILGVTLDGTALANLDCYLNTASELVTRRKVANRVSAGTHILTLTITGTKNASSTGYICYFDYAQAAVPGDIQQPVVLNPHLNAAWDFDTDQTYKLPPSRSLMISRMLGFAGDIDFYSGVFFAQKRFRFGGFFSTWNVLISGDLDPGSGTGGTGDAIWMNIGGTAFVGGTTFGAAMYPLDTNLTLAQRMVDAINAYFVGIYAQALNGDSNTASIFVTLLSPINGFTVDATIASALNITTPPTGTGVLTITGNLNAGNEGIWQIDGTQSQPLNQAFSDYLQDFSTVVNSNNQSATIAFSQELLAPPDVDSKEGAWTQRFADGSTVLTATSFGSWGTNYVEGIS